MTDFDDYDLQYNVNKLIAQGISEGKLTLANGLEYTLRTNDILRLITLAKSTKLAFANVTPSGSLIPDDFVIPTLGVELSAEEKPTEKSISRDTAHLSQNLESDVITNSGKVQPPKAIDFAELERQINKKK